MKQKVSAFMSVLLLLAGVSIGAAIVVSGDNSRVESQATGRLEVHVVGFDAETLSDAGLELFLEVRPANGSGERSQSKRRVPVDSNGFTTQEASEGVWTVVLVGTRPTGADFIIDNRELAVSAARASQAEFDLSQKLYIGRVLWRDVPTSARLRLDAKEDRTSPPVSAMTRADGSFVAVIPHPGHYDVTIESLGRGFSTVVTNVRFDDPSEEVEIQIPLTRVGGRAVDSHGEPVAGAWIRAIKFPDQESVDGEGPGGVLTASDQADSAGRFSLEGLMPGRWEIRGRHKTLRSDPEWVTIRRDATRSDVTVVLRNGLALHGRVLTSSGQAVTGAGGTIGLVPEAPHQIPPGLEFVTDSEGRFDLVSDRVKAEFAYVAVFPEDLPVTVQRVLVSRADDLQIRVPEQPAGLRFLLERPSQSLNPYLYMLVAQDGARVALGTLSAHNAIALPHRWDDVTEIYIPKLAPGRWKLARFSTLADSLEAIGKRPNDLPILAEVELRPGETRSVVLPLLSED